MENKNDPYILTIAQTVRHVKSLQFHPMLGGTVQDLKLARKRIPIPSFLKWARLPVLRNQPCWFCSPDAHSSDTVLSIYRHRDDGHWCVYVTDCDYSDKAWDISDIWYWVAKTCLGRLPYPQWDQKSAALDLLARQSEFDLSVQLDGNSSPATSWARRVRLRTKTEGE
jgi:hypothetical protein